ncbi:hypothetical protein LQF60_11740 [Tetragenococcus koreensis]|uniref:hypothetical protein n=1 Tax=Tetragenococcus koreensis TaxID=290335 RepID=UPI000F4FD449|nr:hypothetical protein [Tetragenococcus koreensis]AYW46478.1 hypothetical protein C7K43_11415 [Tetragenococcus koreensis]MCF1586226.1 hypothetical protein [Tetragenococcus koreensis]MCF1630486.1 hypothetical protein [Tetragenococcus koreensis]GEN92242.1 hypothetical protein TKO01_22880 [Tetragenococcus koreensis]
MYAIYDRVTKQYWNGKFTNQSGYTKPTLTKWAYSKSKMKFTPKTYTSEKRAQKGLEIMLNKLDVISKQNHDFVIVEYETKEF